ncbi:hypothetical protein, partial [Bradyrhizobium sp. STM 3809]|uniref:hypothetical protein n=1 Tax=Bradyrhizobium sp. STM 3809 TaxID=551936 RepID=UPI001112C4B4
MSFAFGAFDGFSQALWKRVPVQNGLGKNEVEKIGQFIRQHVFPIIRHVIDLEAFLAFLVADKPPTIWFVTNPSVRAAQIVAVARMLGRERWEILKYLRPFERIIAIDLSGRPADPREKFVGSLELYVDSLIADLAK